MPSFVEVIVNVPQVMDVFHYHLPLEWEGKIGPGHLVIVPFGQQKVQGVVTRQVAQASVPETRPILDLLDPEPVVTQQQLRLAEELSHQTLATLASCVRIMLPPGLSQQADTLYTLAQHPPQTSQLETPASESTPVRYQPLDKTEERLLALLRRRGALRGRQIDRALPRRNWRPAAQRLIRRGLITSRTVLMAPSVHPKTIRTAMLACLPAEAEAAMPTLARVGSRALTRRQAMLRQLINEPGPVDVSWLYAAVDQQEKNKGNYLEDLRYLEERGLILLRESETWRDPLEDLEAYPDSFAATTPPPLTHDQQVVWQAIHAQLISKNPTPILLHGVTGSGKTEIYLHAVAETLAMKHQAIVLVPEIALTPQTVRRFMNRFPDQVGLIHSRLSEGERYDTWRKARAGLLSVVVGPRSALFTPFANLGLIIMDEYHDESYFESGRMPAYHTLEAAIAYARLTSAVCVAGSATPDVATLYRAEREGWKILRLPERILGHRDAVQRQSQKLGSVSHYRPFEGQAETIDLPPVKVVDMRTELKDGNLSIFSRDLQHALKQVLEQHQQAILFLNRRGTATYVFCRDCGGPIKCPRCDIPLTYHVDDKVTPPSHTRPNRQAGAMLRCHYCNYQRQLPKTCPACGSPRIRQYGAGTEKVESEVCALFPEARTLRWDWDTTRQKGAHETIMSHFVNHRADVLIGTQMLAKGLDLPLVTLVGVILADVGLNLPDYRAAEKTFQVLTQVAGRAGRSPLGGQVILQTYQPDHYVIQAAANHDYAGFYQQELAYRRQLVYPPFTQMVRLEYKASDPRKAEETIRRLARQIQNWIEQEERHATEMIGPVPCFFYRISGQYRWQIVLRGPDPVSLLRGRALGEYEVQVNPPSLL